MNNEREILTINRVKAVVKDIKVSSKGIVLNLENVQLTGTQISEVSALVGGMVFVDLEERLPQSKAQEVAEDEDVNQLSLFEATEQAEEQEEGEKEQQLSDSDVLGELELN
jgi:hypothetical protein